MTTAMTVTGSYAGVIAGVSQVAGTPGQIDVANATTTPTISLDAALLAKIDAVQPTVANISQVNGTAGQITVANGNSVPTVGLDPVILSQLQAVSTGKYNTRVSVDNGIINGEMKVSQRGKTFINTAPFYGLDRWYAWTNGSGGTTGSVQVSQVAGASNNLFGQQVGRPSAGTSVELLGVGQNLNQDLSAPYIGQTVTLGFTAFAGANFSANLNAITVEMLSSTSTTDINLLPTVAGNTQTKSDQTINISNNRSRYTVTFAVPATATQIAFDWFYAPTGTAGAADWFQIEDVTLDLGQVSYPITRQSYNRAMTECQPFYETSYIQSTPPGTANTLTAAEFFLWPYSVYTLPSCPFGQVVFKASKAKIPTCRTYSLLAGTQGSYSIMSSGSSTYQDSTIGSADPINATQRNFYLSSNAKSGSGSANGILVHWSADSECY